MSGAPEAGAAQRAAQTGAAAPALTVAIATYNGRQLLEVALPSIAAQRFRDFTIVVVDDGSTDDTVQWLAAHWPQVTVVRQANAGVTAALNTCLAVADTEFVGLFNNDIEMQPDCLGELVAALREHARAGSAAAKLLDFDRRDIIDGAGDVLLWRGNGHRRGHGEPDRGQYEQAREIFGACGGAVVYRRAALDDVGPFDATFTALFEDVDWSLRAQLAGWTCRYVPTAVVYHKGSATIGAGLTDFARYHLWRNTIWMLAKGLPASSLIRHAPQLLLGQLVNLAVAVRDRRLAVWGRVWVDALRGMPRVLAERRGIQRARRVGPRQLERRIGADG